MKHLKQINIYYFSGTGNTKYLAETLYSCIKKRTELVSISSVEDTVQRKEMLDLSQDSYTVLLYPTYNLNPPRIIYTLIKKVKKLTGRRFALISTCSDPASINQGALFVLRKYMEKQIAIVQYEKRILMPSNAFFRCPDLLANALISQIPKRADELADAIIDGKSGYSSLNLFERFIVYVGKAFLLLTNRFGNSLRVKARCTSCGRCIRECPENNIIMDRGVRFGNKCQLCLRCIYNCPMGAIHSKQYQWIVLNGGYELDKESRNGVSDTSLGSLSWWYRRFIPYLKREMD